MIMVCVVTLRDGPAGLLRVRQLSEITNLILRSTLQECVSKDAKPHCLSFFSSLLV
jgi:hypothetical protein